LFPVPPSVHIENTVFHSRLLLFQHLRSIQRGFLEILGAIRWIAAWDGRELGICTKGC
jgi:hypothetical protein